MSHRSNNNHLNNGDTDDPINHRTERTTATRAATMTPTATATTTAEHKISSHVNQQQQHYSYYNSSAATPFYSQNYVPNMGETYPHHCVADAAAQVWNEWMHEEDQTLQSGSSNNSNSSASMSVTEEALRNMQQQQQQRCYNDRINSPNRHHRFSAESPLISIFYYLPMRRCNKFLNV
jgi:phage-related tail fiber protein